MNRPHSLTDSATAKLNQAEWFGVGLGETCGLNSDEDLPPERLDLELEQHYHTRLLAHVLDVFDLTFQVVPPPFVMRQFVKTGVFLPERLGILFVGAAEMAGCAMFDELRRATGQRHDPCLLDTFIAAVRFMSGEPAKPWWAYTDERKRALEARG